MSRARWLGLIAILPALLAACGSKTTSAPTSSSAAPPATAAPAASSAAATGAAADAGLALSDDSGIVPPKIDFQESEFNESDKSRDPFRSYANMFVEESKGKVKSQREVLLDNYGVDELKLIGIVTGIPVPKAMLVDPTGKGHVVQRGQFIGRPEVVQGSSASGRSYEINWRVDRIRDGDVVLIREDPQNPDVPSSTKVIPLRPEGTIVSEK